MKKKEVNLKRANLPEQIIEVLRKEIFTGEFSPGEDLPSERELSERFGTSRGTMRKALASLAQDGWIEIVHGRGNTVCDFRETVSIEVLPDLIQSCPEAIFTPHFLDLLVELTALIFEQILLDASDNAKPEDEPRLLELMHAQNENLTLNEFWENETKYYGEILRIGNNTLLQMTYNLLIKIVFGMINAGIIRDLAYPIPIYREINEKMIAAVCAGDRPKVTELSRANKAHMIEFYHKLISELSDYSSQGD